MAPARDSLCCEDIVTAKADVKALEQRVDDLRDMMKEFRSNQNAILAGVVLTLVAAVINLLRH